MRKILYAVWIPAIYEQGKPIDGTFKWSGKDREGFFLGWGTSNDGGVHTVGLVQDESGHVIEVLPTNIQFID